MESRPFTHVLAENKSCPAIYRILGLDASSELQITVLLTQEEFGRIHSSDSNRTFSTIEFKDGNKLKLYAPIRVPPGAMTPDRLVSTTVMFGPKYMFIPANFGATIKRMWI